jgi:hypothetical protein
VEGTQKQSISREEIPSDASLFVNEKFDETIGVAYDEIGVIDGTSARLNSLKPKTEKQGK